MEVLRRAEPEVWGVAPFTIGLWVGQRVTPNTTDESHAAIEKERDGKSGTGVDPGPVDQLPVVRFRDRSRAGDKGRQGSRPNLRLLW